MRDTIEVGSYPQGASQYGVLDMAGNVEEWVSDWFDAEYYRYSSYENPTGPLSGDFKVVRGGSWLSDWWQIRVAYRVFIEPESKNDLVRGFRCVSATP